ncbi:ras-related protein rab-6.2-like [Hydractinia symbiolongicarpus]|uniref:ras-related protein rab-6.2-like n=1 Tax=Hydractinia symbiolongicarpus TaxID=13093 RepID=UPI0025511C77|nr:ras-related protein rab-6.2-like [Hydractinia symbiolongicarpus]
MFEENLKKFKLVSLGEQSVGKTSLVTRWMYDSFEDHYQATIGIDFLSKTLHVDEQCVRLQIWDTAGQERFQSLTPAYIRDSSIALIVYDVSDKISFDKVEKWTESVRTERGNAVTIILVANKIDLIHDRIISTKNGEEKAKELDVLFIETSAKSGYNVKKMFQTVVAKALAAPKKTLTVEVKPITVPLPSSREEDSTSSQEGCWC